MAVLTEAEATIQAEKKLMDGIGVWAGFYRKHPHIFVEEYFGLKLKTFQKILLCIFFTFPYAMFLGCRGISKTFTTSVFVSAKAILYPGSKICVASKTLKQAKEVLKYIDTSLCTLSPNLRAEITRVNMNGQDPSIQFANGSIIFVVASSDSARGNRATCLVCDEFVYMKLDIINDVLRKFLTSPRHPAFLDRPEYKDRQDLVERNQEIYLSSCFLKSHWSWSKVKDFACGLLDKSKNYFLCGLPYQLAIQDGLLSREQVEETMREETFSQMKWDMEMGSLFWGESESSFFKYEDLLATRQIETALYPSEIYFAIPDKVLARPHRQTGEIRLLCIDVALMSSKKNKNDATAIFVLQLLPTSNGQYIRNVLYSENHEGGHTETQAIIVRRLFESTECDYIVIDGNGNGLGIYDMLVTDLLDKETGISYEGLSCINDAIMAERYKGSSPMPRKVIYSIKGNSKFNSECAVYLRDAIKRGKLKMLIPEKDIEDIWNESKWYRDLDEAVKIEMKLPYIQTTLAINEMVNLEYELKGANIAIKESADARKDRYSSLSYGNYIANELERKLTKRKPSSDGFDFHFRAPNIMGR